jgi:hypothetical protein
VDEREQPRARRPTLRPVRAGPAPDLEEGLLDRVLRQRRVLEDLVCEPVRDLAEPVVELAERVLVGSGDRLDERLVGPLLGLPHRLALRDVVSPNQRRQRRREGIPCAGGHLRSLPP